MENTEHDNKIKMVQSKKQEKWLDILLEILIEEFERKFNYKTTTTGKTDQ